MKIEDIYKIALSMLSECTSASGNEDYQERTPYIVASCCTQLKGTDASLRRMKGKTAAQTFSSAYISMSDNFPLLDELAPATAMYLAAMLVVDYDPELYDKLFSQFCDNVSMISSNVSGMSESIVNKYFAD